MSTEQELKLLKEEIIRLKKVITTLQKQIAVTEGKIIRSNQLIRENKANIDQIRSRR